MKKLYYLLLLLFALAFSNKVNASHIMGADMQYTCIGNGKYKITIKIYRDCRGIPIGNISLRAFGGNSGRNGCGDISLGSVDRVGIKDVTTKCSSSNNPCGTVPNQQVARRGVEEHTYEKIVDFNTSPLNRFTNNSSCCEVTFYVEQCCRNSTITTGPADDGFASICTINLCNIAKCGDECNSSPQLSSEPIGFICCNFPWYYNNGAIDTIDYDSIAYRLVPGLQNVPSQTVSYNNPFSAKVPLTPYCPNGGVNCTPKPYANPPEGFFFDTITGDIIVQPTNCNEIPIVVIEQIEYRKDTSGNWVVVGVTRRDMQLWIQNCGYNNPPIINGPYIFEVCEGEKICKKIKITDQTFTPNQTVPDTVLAFWNGGITDATFTVVDSTLREKEYEFCWETKEGQASNVPYSFAVRATDQHCTPPMISIRSFQVKVLPKIEVERKYDTLPCGELVVNSISIKGPRDSLTYNWEVYDSANTLISSSSNKIDTINLTKQGKYYIKHTVSRKESCDVEYWDTLFMPQPASAKIQLVDTQVCKQNGIELKTNLKTNRSDYQYFWNSYSFSKNASGVVSYSNKAALAISSDSILMINEVSSDTAFEFLIDFGGGCLFSDTALILANELPIFDLGENKVICWYDTQHFEAPDSNLWVYNWSTGSNLNHINVSESNWYTLTVTNENACVFKDSVNLIANAEFSIKATNDIEICSGETLQLGVTVNNAGGDVYYKWFQKSNNDLVETVPFPNFTLENPNGLDGADWEEVYLVTVSDEKNGKLCFQKDSLSVIVHSNPNVEWNQNPLPTQCFDFGDIILNPNLNKGNTTGIQIWSGSLENKNLFVDSITATRHLFKTTNLDNSKLQSGQNISESVYAKFTNDFGCFSIDSTIQVIQGSPIIELTPKEYCQDLGEAQLSENVITPKSNSGISKVWTVLEQPNDVAGKVVIENRNPMGTPDWRFVFGENAENEFQGDYHLSLCVTNLLSQCRSCDTVINKVISEPKITVNQPNPFCINQGVIDLTQFIDFDAASNSNVKDGVFKITQVNSTTTDPRVGKTLISNTRFPLNYGPGTFQLNYEITQNSCLSKDSLFVFVNDTPDAIIQSDLTICSTESEFDLQSLIDLNQSRPNDGDIAWFGKNVNGNKYTIVSPNSKPLEDADVILLTYTNHNGCIDTETVNIYIQNQPKIEILNPDELLVCDGENLALNSNNLWVDGRLQWLSSGDGSFENALSANTVYYPGTADKSKNTVWLTLKSLPLLGDVCASVNDKVYFKVLSKPILSQINSVEGCVPMELTWSVQEISGLDAKAVKYYWNFGNGVTSNDRITIPLLYKDQGVYHTNVYATHNAKDKSCISDTMQTIVNAYPLPSVYFDSDPFYGTTVKDPNIQFINQTMIDKNPFDPKLKYQWNFGTRTGEGYSEVDNPEFESWPDTGYYEVTLVATTDKGCVDSFKRTLYIGPDTTVLYVFVPDAFTPDQSGPETNEKFTPVVTHSNTYDFKVFNRWGEKLFESNRPGEGWDGTDTNGAPAPAGVYVFQLHVTDYDNEPYVYGGTITLLK